MQLRAFRRVVAVISIAVLIAGPVATGPSYAGTERGAKVKIGSKSFNAVFYDNETARALLEKAPVSYRMSELNGNEKYRYLNYELPENEKHVGRIKAGDIMLYGNDCLVIFYKSFNTDYDYTRIGRITDTSKLRKAAGKGAVTVKISVKKGAFLTSNKIKAKKGKTKTLKLIGADPEKVRWTSSNKKTASVRNGKIYARRKGKTTIKARYGNKTYKCVVTVTSG